VTRTTERPTAAVVGAGVSGLTAAYLLQRAYDVTIFERDDRLGGHAHTHDVATPDDRLVAIDSGFIVHNRTTYPNLIRLFTELGVETQASDMTMSVSCAGCGLEYSGGDGIRGLFAQPKNLANPRFLGLLAQVTGFQRRARALLAADTEAGGGGAASMTLREFLASSRSTPYFVQHFVVPLVSAVWSCPPDTALAYPARSLFRFLDHHGVLRVTGAPEWRTVTGGSRSYVERLAKEITATEVGTPVRSVRRVGDGVEVRDEGDHGQTFERVVVATHADQALAVLAEPTPAERAILGAFTYSRNETVLHTDASLLPRSPHARASWNYRLPQCAGGGAGVQVSYSMNRLQRLDEPVDYVVTLNGGDEIDERAVIARMSYTHPVYTVESVAAQAGLAALDHDRLAFAGAYHGWGFHEDGCAAGVRAADSLGVTW
jgi:predicted NAD/FAD-binding protein